MRKIRIALVAKIKQGDIFAAMERLGWTQNRAAKEFGMSPQDFGRMINLVKVPKYSEKLNDNLIKLTGKNYTELFPDDVERMFSDGKRGRRPLVAYGECDPKAIDMSAIRCLPARSLEDQTAMRDLLNRVLDELEPNRRRVIELRYVNGLAVDEVAQQLGVTSTRVNQIERSAVEAMRKACERQLR